MARTLLRSVLRRFLMITVNVRAHASFWITLIVIQISDSSTWAWHFCLVEHFRKCVQLTALTLGGSCSKTRTTITPSVLHGKPSSVDADYLTSSSWPSCVMPMYGLFGPLAEFCSCCYRNCPPCLEPDHEHSGCRGYRSGCIYVQMFIYTYNALLCICFLYV